MKTAISLLLAVLLSSCIVTIDTDDSDDETIWGSGVAASEERPVAAFDEVAFAAPGTMTFVKGDDEAIHIEGDDNLLGYVETYVRSGTLHVEVEDGVSLRAETPFRYVVTTRGIGVLAVAGTGDVTLAGVTREDFSVSIVGTGDADLSELDVGTLDVSIVGTGDVHLSGMATRLNASLGGTGNLDGPRLSTMHAEVAVLGSGSATLRVRDRLDVTIAGSGSVHYYGSPSVNATILGTGRVVRMGS